MDDDSQPAGNGNSNEFEELESIVEKHEAALLRYAVRIVNDPSAAQDVVQNTFIRLLKCWKKSGAQPAVHLPSWLYRIAHNCAVDHLRRESRHDSLLRRHAEERQCLYGRSEIGEMAEEAARLLKKLSLREQQVVVLKVYEEMSYREISKITGLSESNVGYILHYAMKKLAALLKVQPPSSWTDGLRRPGRSE